jgi:hypothetical protein
MHPHLLDVIPIVHGLLERDMQSEFEDLSDIFGVEDSRELVDRPS